MNGNEDRHHRLSLPNLFNNVSLRILLLGILAFMVIGTILYPAWWDEFLFGGMLFTSEHWVIGITYIFRAYFIPILVVGALLLALLTLALRFNFLSRKIGELWDILKRGMAGIPGSAAIGILTILLAVSLVSLQERSHQERIRLEESDYQQFSESFRIREGGTQITFGTETQLLPELTSFIYLSRENVESLYGQLESGLVISTITEGTQGQTRIDGGVDTPLIDIGAGASNSETREVVYEGPPKSDEQKVQDVVKHLNKQNDLRRFRDFRSDSRELRELDQAVKLLGGEYELYVNSDKLREVKDLLFAEEKDAFLAEIKELSGYILVEGDWIITDQSDSFLFTHYFIEDITSPPTSEFELRRDSLANEYIDAFQEHYDSSIKITIFGKVINVIGNAGDSQKVLVFPIAVY